MLGANNDYSAVICRSASSVKWASSERSSSSLATMPFVRKSMPTLATTPGLLERRVDNRVGVIVALRL
jgi:hypothetical protein